MSAKTISIHTPQQVVIQYDLASTLNRTFAALIDMMITLVCISIILGLNNYLNDQLFSGWLIFIVWTFYHPFFEWIWTGQTPGKKMMGLLVISNTGEPLGMEQIVIRWVFRSLDIFLTLGSLAVLLISSTEKNQRLGDLLAGTLVIKNKTDLDFKLRDIEKFHSIQANVLYPQVRNLSESDVLFIRKLMFADHLYDAKTYEILLSETAFRISQTLRIPYQESIDPKSFLEQIIQDYIVVTR